jgi:RimJ/RimL family protein N-acetyltransferase
MMKRMSEKSQIRVRRARASDRAAVFKICEKTWSWGDYIPKVWDRWLKDKNSRVFVATINEIPVGITQLSIDKPHEVWLRGARTDPNYRRMGVATAITKKCLEYAKRKGVKVARLVTETDNIAAQAVLRKLGFQPIAEFAQMTTDNIAKAESKGAKWAGKDEAEAMWAYLQTSEIYRRAAGLYTLVYQWFSLEKQDLERFITQQKAIIHKNREGKVDGLMLIDDDTAREWRENSIQTCYIDGDHDTVLDMAKFLKNHCNMLGVKKIYAFTPNCKPVTTALEKLGFKMPDAISIVYEKKL